MKPHGLLLLVLAAALCLGARSAPSSLLSSQKDYAAISPSIVAALNKGQTTPWRGAVAWGSVTPLQFTASDGSGACSGTSCCPGYIVVYETADYLAKYKGRACRDGQGWSRRGTETLMQGPQFEVVYKPLQQAPQEDIPAHNRQVAEALTTLRYLEASSNPSDVKGALVVFLADEGAAATTTQETLALLNAAIKRSEHVGCPAQALASLQPNRACAIVPASN